MQHRRLFAWLCLSAALSLALPASAPAQDREPSPGPNWVFNERGQKTDQPALVDVSVNDAFFPISVNNHWGLMNQNGEVVIFPRYEWTDYDFEGLTRYMSGGKTGYLRGDPDDDTDPNEFHIQAKFDYADRYCNGTAVVMIDNKWGVIDKAGRVVVPMEFDGVLRFQEGFAGVQRGERCGFVNRAGDLKIPLQFKKVRSFHNGFAAVQLPDDRWGYIDKRGKVVWVDDTGRVRLLGDFHEQYARVQVELRNGVIRWGYLTRGFRYRLDPVYEDARDFSDGIAAVKQDGKWGFIYGNGKWVIQPQFDDADDFDDAEGSNDFDSDRAEREKQDGRDLSTAGLYAMVKLDGRWGYINRAANGGLVPQFKDAEPFFRGLARVERDGSFAYVGETGQVRWDPRVAVNLGFVDRTGKEKARLAQIGNTQVGGQTNDNPANEVIPAPPPRKQAEVPYVSEAKYEEMLPAVKQ